MGDEIAVVESLDAAKTKFSFMNDSDDEAKPDTADAAETKTNIIQVNNEIPEDLHPQKASEESEPASNMIHLQSQSRRISHNFFK